MVNGTSVFGRDMVFIGIQMVTIIMANGKITKESEKKKIFSANQLLIADWIIKKKKTIDKKEGFGIYHFADGRFYEGEWVDDKFVGTPQIHEKKKPSSKIVSQLK